MSFNPQVSIIYLVNFLRDTIVGLNRGIYRAFKNDQNLVMFKDPAIMQVTFLYSLAEFLNKGYRALIYSYNGKFKREQDKDDYWKQRFNQFIHPDQSFICALNKLLALIQVLNSDIDYMKLDITDIEKMSNSLIEQLNDILMKKRSDIIAIGDHYKQACNGDKIENCDPKEDLFVLKKD